MSSHFEKWNLSEWPYFSERDFLSLKNVFLEKDWRGQKVLDGFSREFCDYLGASYGLPVNSGTSALEIALQALSLQSDDEVMVPSYAFYSAVSAVLKAGARVRFVDVRVEDGCVDPASIRRVCNSKTKALIVLHFGGNPADFGQILPFCKKRGIRIVEDVAHAVGSEWKGKKLGTLGDIGCFSFQAWKNLSAGEGGYITTRSKRLFSICESLANVGSFSGRPLHEHVLLGGNYRMTKFQAAVLRLQLRKLESQITVREKNVAFLRRELLRLGLLPFERPSFATRVSYHLFGFRILTKGLRNKILARMKSLGIPGGGGYVRPLSEQPVFAELIKEKGEARNARQLCETWVGFEHTLLMATRTDLEKVLFEIEDVMKAGSRHAF